MFLLILPGSARDTMMRDMAHQPKRALISLETGSTHRPGSRCSRCKPCRAPPLASISGSPHPYTGRLIDTSADLSCALAHLPSPPKPPLHAVGRDANMPQTLSG